MKYAIIAIVLVLTAAAPALSQKGRQMPAVRDAKAIEELKNDGSYEELLRAVLKTKNINPSDDEAMGQTERLTAIDGASGDHFGSSIAVSGNTAIVGAPADDGGRGAAYVYVRTPTGWTQQAKLIASDGAALDNFGVSVAIFGSTAVVGANVDDVAGADQGSAYVFVRSGVVWSEQSKLTASDGVAGDEFGRSVAVYGETAVVGAFGDDLAGPDQGSAYVFTRAGVTWSEQSKLTASDGAAGDKFGESVSVWNDTVVVGAKFADVAANTDQGAAYVFVRTGVVWAEQTKLTAADGAAGDEFGGTVSISAETVIAGAANDSVGANAAQGSAYVYVRTGMIWSQQTQLTSAGGSAGDRFGTSVSVSGQTAIVGAIASDIGSNIDQGAAYVFARSGIVWTQDSKLVSSNGFGGDSFGSGVAIEGEIAVVGAFLHDTGGNVDQGSAYAFRVLNSSWQQEALKVASDGAANDNFGFSVAISGDTAVVGSYHDDAPLTDQGSAYVYVRTGTTWTQQAKLTASDGAANDNFGVAVSIYGDTIIVGSHLDDGAFTDQGSAYVFVRTGGAWSQQAKLVAPDGAQDDIFGFCVDIFGDTAVVGATFDNGAFADQGSVYVYVRSGAIWTQQAKLVAADAGATDLFGRSVDLYGDTLAIGADLDNVTFADQGSVYVFVRNGLVWSQQAKLTASDAGVDDQFGYCVSVYGDTLVVGANLADDSFADQGVAYVFVRSGTSWSENARLIQPGAAAGDLFGFSVAIYGDFVVVGSVLDDGAFADEGGAYVFRRSGANWSFQQKLNHSPSAAADLFGFGVGISGDRIIVGALSSDQSVPIPFTSPSTPQAVDQGAAYIFANVIVTTAASASVSGRVLSSDGRALRNAIVFLTDDQGNTRQFRTGTFGNFTFDSVRAGQTVTVSVSAKGFDFTPRIVSIQGNVADLEIAPEN